MRNRAPQLQQDSVRTITQFLQESMKVKNIADQTGVPVHQIYKLRRKLSKIGVIQVAKRKSRSVKKSNAAVVDNTTTTVTKTKAVTENTVSNDFSNVRSYEFNVNGMKVTVAGAREVAFTNKSIDIKY